MSDTHITEVHKVVFSMLRDEDCEHFALVSCFVNGEPSVAISWCKVDPETKETTVIPVFVWVTKSMVLTDHQRVSTI